MVQHRPGRHTLTRGRAALPADEHDLGRRDHRAYGTTILITGTAWFLLGLSIALARDLSLADYLIKIFLPSSPALLDCTELARSHWRHAAGRENAEQDIQDIWNAHRDNPASIDPTACRNIQDTAYLLRRHGPRVPSFFYKLRRPATQAAMAAGVTSLRSRPSNWGDDGSERAP